MGLAFPGKPDLPQPAPDQGPYLSQATSSHLRSGHDPSTSCPASAAPNLLSTQRPELCPFVKANHDKPEDDFQFRCILKPTMNQRPKSHRPARRDRWAVGVGTHTPLAQAACGRLLSVSPSSESPGRQDKVGHPTMGSHQLL